jgi:hypothetical protein
MQLKHTLILHILLSLGPNSKDSSAYLLLDQMHTFNMLKVGAKGISSIMVLNVP